ncbi:hypothetical protein [Pseudomonas amygdali]|nr:hypothetical protein [Pseudomonas amygdali]KPC17144.1 Uncharacterized protein AC499_0346 [Pseudomonas amygdali pv. lachrymans]KPC18103.1 Uncharacterized protein AC499_1305 [Pseudomonas amygdali pv. lachrymans]
MFIPCASCGITTMIATALPDKDLIDMAQMNFLYQIIMACMIVMIIAGLGYGLILSAKRIELRNAAAQSRAQQTQAIKAPVDPE